jgi:acyl-protein synthetase LuxE
MPKIRALENRLFKINSPDCFNDLAIEIFQFQYINNIVYKRFVDLICAAPKKIYHHSQIPFIPIEFFKDHKIVSGDFNAKMVFTSSGTTGMKPSNHYVKDLKIYERSFSESFKYFFGLPESYVILALLPSYMERNGSSLVYMADHLISNSSNNASGFYLNEYQELYNLLLELKEKQSKVILLGVTYALMDFAEIFKIDFPNLILMETGGMKGRRKEMIRNEVHGKLIEAFGTPKVYSEYGMTELLSQAYSMGDGIFNSPPWMRVLIRDINDPVSYLDYEKSGAINIIDLANIHSCSFVATQDLGIKHHNGSFEVIGRFDNSDVRGCNLMVGNL